MAEGSQENLKEEIIQNNGSGNTIQCKPCSTTNSVIEASLYCMQCKEYICKECSLHHRKFAMLRDHEITDKLNEIELIEDGHKDYFSRRCDFHEKNIIEKFCISHSVLCCGQCIDENHAECLSEQINVVAKGFTGSEACKKILNQLVSMKTEVKELLEEEYEEAETELQKYSMEGVARAKDISIKIIGSYIDAIGEELKKQIQQTMSRSTMKLIDILHEVQRCEVLMDSKADIEEDLFIFSNRQKPKLSKLSDYVKYCKENLPCPWIVNVNNEYENILNQFISVKRTTKKIVEIKQEKENDCQVSDIECLSDGRYVIADISNKKLKLFTRNGELVVNENTEGKVWAVAEIVPGKIAAILPVEKLVQVFEMGDRIKKLNQVDLDENPTGLSSFDGKLFLSFKEHVRVMKSEGDWLERISKNESGENLFTAISGILANTKTGLIYIIDDGNLYALDAESIRGDKRRSMVRLTNEMEFKATMTLAQDDSIYVTSSSGLMHYTSDLKLIQKFAIDHFIQHADLRENNASSPRTAAAGKIGQNRKRTTGFTFGGSPSNPTVQVKAFGIPFDFSSAESTQSVTQTAKASQNLTPLSGFASPSEEKHIFPTYCVCYNECIGNIYIGTKSNSLVIVRIG